MIITEEQYRSMPLAFDVKWLAGALGVNQATIYSWIADGKLKKYKFGKSSVLLRRDVAEMLDIKGDEEMMRMLGKLADDGGDSNE